MSTPDPRAAGGWQPDYEPAMLENVLPAEMCDDAIATAKRIGFEPSPLFYGSEPGQNTDFRKSETAWINPDDFPELYRAITRTLQRVNNELYRFSINGMDQIQIIRYLPGSFFVDHTDIAHAHAANRKISLVVQLSDPADYEGGELVLAGRLRMPGTRGGGSVFPSWVQHRVEPITSGTRYSLAAWGRGAWFN